MSLKMIAASKSNRWMGCNVTSHASSGVRQMVKKSCCLRVSLNSVWEVPSYVMVYMETVFTVYAHGQ